MLFAKVWFVVEQKGMPAGAHSLAPNFEFTTKRIPAITDIEFHRSASRFHLRD